VSPRATEGTAGGRHGRLEAVVALERPRGRESARLHNQEQGESQCRVLGTPSLALSTPGLWRGIMNGQTFNLESMEVTELHVTTIAPPWAYVSASWTSSWARESG